MQSTPPSPAAPPSSPPPPFVIRRARAEHVAQIAQITHDEARRSAASVASGDEPPERWRVDWEAQSPLYPWLVALDPRRPAGEEVVGYAKASPFNVRDGFRWSVALSVYLKPEVKGAGLGVALYGELFPLLRAQGYLRVYARIALPNPPSQALHERFGLRQTGLLPRFAWKFGRWFDMGIYTGSLVEDERAPRGVVGVEEACLIGARHLLCAD